MLRVIQTINEYIKFNKYIRVSGIVSSFVLFILLSLSIHPIVLDSSAEATAGTSLPSTTTLTMALGSSSANLDIMPKDSNGTFSSSSTDETAKFGVTTNNYTGYTLTISASDDLGTLTNSTAASTLSSISTVTDSATFSSTTALNGKWGYLPSKYNSETNLVYRPAPTTTASTLDATTTANPTTANDYTIGLGARIDYTKPAGTYTNTFVLSAIANPVPYAITYSDNTGDSSVKNLPVFEGNTTNHTQTGDIASTNVTLSSTVPTRTGYTFKSWCLGTVSNSGTTCTGTSFNAGANFGMDQTIANTATLYATWTVNTYNITIKTATGISKVTLNGTECTSTSGCAVNGLTFGKSYNLVATLSTGYTFTKWAPGSYGSVASTTTASTTYTVGAGASTITPTATINKYSLTITFAGYGVSNVQVRSASGTGGNLLGTVSSSGGSVSNLTYGTTYYLYPTYSSNYKINKWAKTDSASGAALSSTTAANPTYKIGLGNGAVTITGQPTYIQDLTAAQCSTLASSANATVRDRRDNQDYTVRYINSKCWMTRNLAIGCNGSGTTYGSSVSSKSLNSTYSNVSSTWSTPTALLSAASSSTQTADYSAGRMQCNATYGAWYNYFAATAGTISTNSNTTAASKDICPKGWRLPTKAEFDGIASSATAFSPVTGGYYSSGSLSSTGFGFWWSATSYDATGRYYLGYNGSSLSTTDVTRYRGLYVRCIKS